MGEIVAQVVAREFVVPEGEYKMAGVKWYGEGVFHRETVLGRETSAKHLTPLVPGALIYNRLFAWKESFAVVGQEHRGLYVSGEFPQFVPDKAGVLPEFFSHYQKDADFNAAYKRIRKDWFFHNPTRSSVGSLGIVPDVPEDAITSPEYQVWRIREGRLLPDFVAVLVTTAYFIKLVQFHRVGAVKQRLYVENLLAIPIPEVPERIQREIAEARQAALLAIRDARERRRQVADEVEALILGGSRGLQEGVSAW